MEVNQACTSNLRVESWIFFFMPVSASTGGLRLNMRDIFASPTRYTVLLLDVTLFLLKAIGEIDFSHKWAQCLVLIIGLSFRGIHQIGLSQCESETLEGCFGGRSPSHWRRCLLLTGYYTVLMGTTESCWVLTTKNHWTLLGITTGQLLRPWYWQGACSEACWLGMPGGLRWQVHHILLLKSKLI